MDNTLNKIKEISVKLVPLIDASQELEKLASYMMYEVEVDDLVDLVDVKINEKNKEIRSLVEELEHFVILYLALTTPYTRPAENDKELEELEELYEQYKQLTSIGPDPEVGYDRSYEAELSRLEDQIDCLEAELLDPSE